jgi:hypothetical protein
MEMSSNRCSTCPRRPAKGFYEDAIKQYLREIEKSKLLIQTVTASVTIMTELFTRSMKILVLLGCASASKSDPPSVPQLDPHKINNVKKATP